jgi:uncharacterized protein YndB with AHSA1/START domain
MFRLLAIAALVASGPSGAAEITPNGFRVKQELRIAAPPAKVFESLTGQIGAWWNEQHTYSGDSRNLSIEPRPGGCFCERLVDGGIEHMRVVQVRSPRVLRMVGGLGPLQGTGVAGAWTWQLSALDGGTKLELDYVVGGFLPGGFEKLAPLVESVLGEQAERLKRFVETGTPVVPK